MLAVKDRVEFPECIPSRLIECANEYHSNSLSSFHTSENRAILHFYTPVAPRSKIVANNAKAHLEAHRLHAAQIRDDAKHLHYRTLLGPRGKRKRRLWQRSPPVTPVSKRSEATISHSSDHSASSSRRQLDPSLNSSENTPSHISVPRVLSSDANDRSAERTCQASSSAGETFTTAVFKSPATAAPLHMPGRSSDDFSQRGTSAGPKNLLRCFHLNTSGR